MRHRPPAFVVGLQELPPDAALYAPAVDVLAQANGFRLVFEIPGAQPDRISIEVKGRLVTLRGERRPTEGESGSFLRVERAAGPFERVVELPDEPDSETAQASYADGLLTVDLPRRAAPRGRSIPIQRSGGAR
jgi:HSP20 family protein